MRGILVAPSILSSDFSRLEEEVKKIKDSGADMVHIDVMDGQFVPNITIGPVVVREIRKCTDLPLDVHLMIEEPHRFVKEFAEAGSDIITVHAEAYGRQIRNPKSGPFDKLRAALSKRSASKGEIQKGNSVTTDKINEAQVKEVLAQIKSFGKKAGISLNPDSPFCIKGILGEVDMILIMSVHPGFGGQTFIPDILPKIREARKLFSGDIEVDGGVNDKNIASIVDAGANIIVAGSYFFSAKDPKEAVKRLRIK